MDADPFWSARRRLARTDKHLSDLKAEIDAYFSADAYSIVREKNTRMASEIHKIRFKSLPDIIADTVFDAISNLRASLDHAAFVVASAHNTRLANNAHFPISKTQNGLAELLRKYGKTYPADILEWFRMIEPYIGGNANGIAALNAIRNQAEHRILVQCKAGAGTRLIRARGSAPRGASFFPFIPSENNDVKFAVIPFGTNIQYDLEVEPFIAFGDASDAFAWENVEHRLKAVRDEAARTITALLDEARRLQLL